MKLTPDIIRKFAGEIIYRWRNSKRRVEKYCEKKHAP
jgi:hypothetical protein